jgi:hypothetical protein
MAFATIAGGFYAFFIHQDKTVQYDHAHVEADELHGAVACGGGIVDREGKDLENDLKHRD